MAARPGRAGALHEGAEERQETRSMSTSKSPPGNIARRVVLAAAAGGLAVQAAAAPLPEGELERRCWLQYTTERTKVDLREPTAVHFSNLADGYQVDSPFLVEFAVRGMGVVPAGKKFDGAGHHHILVNKKLPLSITEQIPFDAHHKHFGKGQTSTTLDLPPGRHTLRLLFADHEHRPYFVFSREIAVQVRGPRGNGTRPVIDPARFDATCALWHQDEVSRPRPPAEPLYFANVRAGEPLQSPFNLRLGVDGLGVCARGLGVEKTGHFIVELLLPGGSAPVQTFALTNGATQVNVFAPNGSYRMRLKFVDDKGTEVLPAHELPVRVVTQERY
jgi:hypothetical protein